MNGGEWTAGLLIFLLVLLAMSKMWTWQRNGGAARLVALLPTPQRLVYNAPMPTSVPKVQRVYSPAVRSRTQTRAERRIIRASLAAGVDPQAVAAALRGNRAYNRRRVREMAAQK